MLFSMIWECSQRHFMLQSKQDHLTFSVMYFIWSVSQISDPEIVQGLKYFWFVSFPRHIALFNDTLNLICSTSRSSPLFLCFFFTPALAECDFNQYPDWILFDLLHQSQFSETLADRSSGLPYISHPKNTLSKWGLDVSVCFENRMCLEKDHTAKFMCLAPWQNSLLF